MMKSRFNKVSTFGNDLFKSKCQNPHDLFIKLCVEKNEARREHINSIWQWYSSAELYDDHFITEFSLNTSNRWWELEVAWFLRNCGVTISKNGAGSDFMCQFGGNKFEVEAVVAGTGSDDNPDQVPELFYQGDADYKFTGHIDIIERERLELLRLTSSIDSKAKKHLCDIKKGHSDPSVPFIIALSPVDIMPLVSNAGLFSALKAVYAIGDQYFDIDPLTGNFVGHSWEYRPTICKSSTEEPISTQIFCPIPKPFRYRNVSALLFSTLDIWESGYPFSFSEHSERFVLIHNANCFNKIPKHCIRAGTEYWLETAYDGYRLVKNDNF